MTFAFPNTQYTRGNHGHAPMEPSYTEPGMSLEAFYFAHILGGLASNPTTMLNIEDHMAYAERMARKAASMVT